MSFHEVRLPDTVERGARGGPGFRTTVTVLTSGFEQRNSRWQRARASYDISYGISTKEIFREVIQFFYARRGRLFGFRFRDWSDYECENELIGITDGTFTQLQLQKTYEDAGGFYVRPITKPVAGTVRIFINGSEQIEGSDFTVDNTTGVVTFSSPPPNGAQVSATFEFDVPVRFESDDLNIALDWENAGSIPAMGLVEIRQRLTELT